MPTAVNSIAREHVESFIEDLDSRFRPATVAVRYKSLKQLFRWLLEEGEITSDPMARMRLPSVPEDPPAVLSEKELRALLKACEGQDFVARRDTAIVRMFIDTGARLSEITGLRLDDVDLDKQTLTVTGKGSRVRVLPVGVKAVKAIDRYLRVRRGRREHGSRRCGSVTRERWGPAASRRCCDAGRPRLGSTTSTRTSSGIRSPTNGSAPRAPRVT